MVFRLAGRPMGARREFEITLRLNPVYPPAHQQLAFSFGEIGRLTDAERSFENAMDLNPSDTTARDGLDEFLRILRALKKQNRPASTTRPDTPALHSFP